MTGPDPRAWGWVAALRAGGTTPWSPWREGSGAAAPPAARDLPGAAQLELLRRVNLANAGPAHPALVDRILTASPAGRGAPDLELVGATPDRPWGPSPVDPAALRDHDLLRVAATVLAEDVVAAAPPERSGRAARVATLPRRVRGRLLRLRRGHRLVGDPWLGLTVRDELLRRGRRLGGPASTVVVVGDDVASMLVDAFTAKAFGAGGTGWEAWLGPVARVDRPLPPSVDLTRVTRRWGEEVGPRRVVVVPDPALLPQTLGLPAGAGARLTPPRPSADAVDLARRVATPLGLLAPPDERRRLLRRVLLPLLMADLRAHPAPPLAVPDAHLPWVVRRAEQMRDDLRAARYPVVGDLQALVPDVGAPAPTGAVPDDAGVLALAIRLLLAGSRTAPASTAGPDHEEGR